MHDPININDTVIDNAIRDTYNEQSFKNLHKSFDDRHYEEDISWLNEFKQ